MKLAQAQALAEIDLQNSPLYVHRREKARKQLEAFIVLRGETDAR